MGAEALPWCGIRAYNAQIRKVYSVRRAHSISAVLVAAAILLTACGSQNATEDAATEATTEAASLVETIPAEEAAVDDTPIELAEGEVPVGVVTGETSEAPELNVNWDQMDGVVGWLVIPGADVSVGIYETEHADGAWLDPNNYSDYTDPDTVIHGGAAAGQVLHSVLRYEDSEVYDANRQIYVYTPDGQVIAYTIFAAYAADTEDILANHDCTDYDSFSSYVSSIYAIRSMGAHLDTDLQGEVLGTWQMLTIQASDGAGSDYLLQATLTGSGLSQ